MIPPLGQSLNIFHSPVYDGIPNSMYKVPVEDKAGEREGLDRGKETIYYKIKVIVLFTVLC